MQQQPKAGVPETVGPGVVRVLAPNPSPMTYHGTNTYLLGTQESLVVLDPGPDSPSHLEALLSAIGARPVSHILVSHSHLDHSPLARRLSDAVAAPVLAYGSHAAGRRPIMQELAKTGQIGGGEGADTDFTPDRTLLDGEILESPDGKIEVLHLPGHIANHLGFSWNSQLFVGDHVMGWASSLVSPPDGDLTAFMASCVRLLTRSETLYHCGHGDPITDGPARVRWLIEHRNARTSQLRAALQDGAGGLISLTERVYTDIDRHMLPAAARNLLAHLIALIETGEVKAQPSLSADATFALV